LFAGALLSRGRGKGHGPILWLSLILQTVAAIISLRLIIMKKRFLAGAIMLLVMMFMIVRLFMSLYRLFGFAEGPNLAPEVSACAVSLLLVAGFLHSSRRASYLRTLSAAHPQRRFLPLQLLFRLLP
jgi:hypothetical protein